jgi:Protein of unknown function (DUF763)
LTPLSQELGIHVCGGRGKHSRQTKAKLLAAGERIVIVGAGLAKASRLVAKVDSAAMQDGFDLYLHGFIVTDEGRWVVLQQGMNGDRKQAPQALKCCAAHSRETERPIQVSSLQIHCHAGRNSVGRPPLTHLGRPSAPGRAGLGLHLTGPQNRSGRMTPSVAGGSH